MALGNFNHAEVHPAPLGLQVSVLLAPMGHFFLVTVPENDPEGESLQWHPPHRLPDAWLLSPDVVLLPTEILLILAKQGLKGAEQRCVC